MNTRTRFQKEAKGNSEMAYLKKQIYMCMRQSGSNVKLILQIVCRWCLPIHETRPYIISASGGE